MQDVGDGGDGAVAGVWVQFAALGLVFTATCGVFYLFLGVMSDRVLSARPEAAAVTSKIASAAMVVVGVPLLAEHLLLSGH